MTKPDYVVSDTHLGAVSQDTERAFERFLEHVAGAAHSLLINGDLFDFWFEWGQVVPSQHYRTLAALSHVVEAGVPVTLIGGNHDAWGGRFLSEEIGLHLHDGVLRTLLAGRHTVIAHGDGLGKGDYKYRLLKAVLRSPVAVWGFRALHPELGMKIADRVSSTEKHALNDAGSENRAAFLEHWAREQLQLDPALSLVLCGHAHVPAVQQVEPNRYYVNSGDWVRHRTYVVLEPEAAPRLLSWDAQPSE